MMPSEALYVLCAGACQSLFNRVRPRLASLPIRADFGPVGRLSDLLRSGCGADVLLSSRGALGALVKEGHVEHASIWPVGRVPTTVAACLGTSGTALSTACGDAERFADALRTINHIYLPDTRRATAGIHMRRLFESLGMAEVLAPRLHELPSSAAALAKMVEDGFASAVGFAQRTEIVATPGVILVGNLPRGYELVTEYCGALARKPSPNPNAQVFLDLLNRHISPDLLQQLGFLDTGQPF
jgi:molybdate transport system substrate-binding protein